MRVIWWRITRPDITEAPATLVGDSLNIHLPEDWSPVQVMQDGQHTVDRDWLNRLLRWSDGESDTPER